MNLGYQVTDEDVLVVLQANQQHLVNPHKQSLCTLAEAAFEEMYGMGVTAQIALDALDASTELDEQTEAANADIRKFLVEQGLLKE